MGQSRNVAVVTDTNSGIMEDEAARLGVFVVPMPFVVDGEECFEGVILDAERFYERQIAGADIVTSQPSIVDLGKRWAELLEAYDEVVYIPMSSGLSGSCETACQVAAHCNGRVHVVDNQRISVTQREAVLDALSFDDAVVIEQWIEGVELAVSVLGTGWDAYALPPVEVVAKQGLYDTAARLTPGAVEYHAPVRPASLSNDEADAQAIRAEIERAALEVYRAYQVRDLARIDLIWDGAQARVFEVNVSPGMTETSLFPAACEAAGLSLPSVLNELVSQYA